MEHISFDNLPTAVAALSEKIDTMMSFLKDKFTTTEQPNNEPVILTTDEAAALLNRKPSSVYQMTSEGRIPFHKRGNKLYFFKHELLQWLQDGGSSGVGTEADFNAHLDSLRQGKRRRPQGGIG